MKTIVSKRFRTAILASAALMAATVVTPQQAKADATLAAVLGGSALLGLILHANQPILAPRFQRANSMLRHQSYAAPAQVAMPAYQPYPSYAPVVYASVAPAPMHQNAYRVVQPVRYQVTAPSASPMQGVYHSSANMSYPMQSQPQHQLAEDPMQQAMMQQMQQPAQAQQMSYQQPGQYGMGMAQPQYGTTYPQY
ncbi:MAG: hypothetical protein HQL70_03350 [Magnetococcales bacterium]|nr:hypothetical protein [Magnetococcales bacterium]